MFFSLTHVLVWLLGQTWNEGDKVRQARITCFKLQYHNILAGMLVSSDLGARHSSGASCWNMVG